MVSGRRGWRSARAYRLYFGKAKDAVVLLLLGGDKGSQTKDIKQAKRYWASYVKETKHGKTK